MHKYRDLKVWQRALAFTILIYQEAAKYFPSDERFGLTSQIRRASSSMPLNIAEGSGCSSNKEFCRFLEIAKRSGYEVMTAIDIGRGLNYWPNAIADSLLAELDELVAMIVGLMRTLERRNLSEI